MKQDDREALVAQLKDAGMGSANASQYVDAFLEYRQSSGEIAQHGIIVLHPRTGAPMENPFLAVRDRALKKLQGMIDTRADALWSSR